MLQPLKEEKSLVKKMIPFLVLLFLFLTIVVFFLKNNKQQKIVEPVVPKEENNYELPQKSPLDLSDIYKETKGTDNIKLSTLGDFLDIRERINSKESFKDKKILLENDINLTENGEKNGGALLWNIIGSKDKPFDGIFDGKGKILNCNLNFKEDNSGLSSFVFSTTSEDSSFFDFNIRGKIEGDYSSFIGENSGNIKNINIEIVANNTSTTLSGVCDFNKGSISDCSISGEFYTNDMNLAGICASNEGIIFNCSINNLKLNNCVKKLSSEPIGKNLEGEEMWFQLPETAGIASFNEGKIEKCSVSGVHLENKGKNGTAGGISSTNNGLIINCNFEGNIIAGSAGGLTGSNYGVITDCFVKNTNISAKEGAEFAQKNQFGADGYEWSELKGKDLGVIENCNFDNGKIEVLRYKIAAQLNLEDNTFYSSEERALLKFPRNPSIKNCFVNSKPVTRDKD